MSRTVCWASDLLRVSKYWQDSAESRCFSTAVVQRIIYQSIWAHFGWGKCLTFDPTELALKKKKRPQDGAGGISWEKVVGDSFLHNERGKVWGLGEDFLMAFGELRSDARHEPAEQLGEHISPFSLRRISVETSGHRPRWFYRPCAKERGHLKRFSLHRRPQTRVLEARFPHTLYRWCHW